MDLSSMLAPVEPEPPAAAAAATTTAPPTSTPTPATTTVEAAPTHPPLAPAAAPPPGDIATVPTSMAPKRKADQLDDDDAAAATPRASSLPNGDNDKDEPMYTSTTTSVRHNKSGATSSVYSGNKIRHLKKEDGIPLWRKDIQYDFLKLVFDDTTACFTKYSDGTKGHTFADIYIDAMAKSSKCSKILKEKLLQDQAGAISMAMVCLLVNVGRMNTTLNFFPEMRAQLRTYHSIPALQADQDPNAYKQLQDAPRLKSILKGATEDEPQPSTMEEIKAASIPRTNPVNLIFVMSQYAPKISEVHFPPPRDFFDLVMRPTLSSESRAKAFLWLVWWYLESDFSAEATRNNPFGNGVFGEGEEGTGALPLKVPTLVGLTDEQAEQENVDTESEKHFGEVKRKERIAILASEPSPAMTALKRARKEKGLTTGHNPAPSDDEGSESGYHRMPGPTSVGRSALHHETASDYTRSPSPAARGFNAVNHKPLGGMGINNLLNSDDAIPDPSPPASTAPAKKGPGRGNWRRNRGGKDANATAAGASSSQPVPLLPNTSSQMPFVNTGPNGPVHGQGSVIAFGNTNKLAGATGMSPGGQQVSFQHATTHIPTPSYQAQKRHRGITQHQSAVINHRKMQIDYTLDRRIRKAHQKARRRRESESAMIRAWKRLKYMPADHDSEEEQIKIRKAKDRAEKNDDWHRGATVDDPFDNVDLWRRPRVLYAGFVKTPQESGDVGEESKSLAQSFRRCSRRLDRWEGNLPGQSMAKRLEQEKYGASFGAERRSTADRSRAISAATYEGSERPGDRVSHPRKRQSIKRERSDPTRRPQGVRRDTSDKMDVDPEPDDEDGGAELDEEDRDLLAEVDADEDASEDEDEEMEH
ncbi:putative ino80 subunit 1 protein [Septoria linicola]|nr:putative ino80 subunit 1 protein [Septoria linicola]